MSLEKVDFGYEAADFVYLLLINGMTGYCLVRLVKPFLSEGVKVWTAGVVYCIMMEFLQYMPWYINNFCAYGLGILAAFLTVYWLERKNAAQKIFLGVTFFSLRWLSFMMEGCIDKVCDRFFTKIPGYSENMWIPFYSFIILCVLDLIFSYLFLMSAVHLVKKNYIYKRLAMTKKEMFMLLVPSLSAMLGYMILKYYENLYEADVGKSLYYVYGTYNWLSFFYYGFSIAAILVFIILYQDLKRRQTEEKQYALLAGQAADMARHVREVEKLYGHIRSLKHDMGNHMMVLEGLYQNNEKEEAKRYVEKLRKQLGENALSVQSGNPVTDVILTEKKKAMEEKGISFLCDFHYPQEEAPDAFDISVILNNALTNAIEASEKEISRGKREQTVMLSSYGRKNVFMIEIKNSFAGTLPMGGDRLPASTKAGEGHGFGLANIRKVAGKYCGDVEIECRDGWCAVNVMLLLENS